MAVQVYQPQPKSREEERALIGAAGTIGGAVLGPAGAAIGGTAGGMVGSQVAPDQAAPQSVQSGGGATPGGPAQPSQQLTMESAVQRRQQAIQDADAMTDAYAAVQNDPQLKKQYGPMLHDGTQSALQRRMV